MTTRLVGNMLSVLLIAGGFLATLPVLHAQVKVSTADALKAAVHKPNPEYTVVARQMKATGRVEVEVSISADGKVEEVRIISGNPLLTKASAKTAKDWTFTPFLDNGQPSRAVAVLSFEFKL